MAREFGDIPGVAAGATFETREAVAAAGLHKPLQAGISGGAKEGADSIVLSGGYEDDEDHGDVIVYAGHGGKDLSTGQQIAHQKLTRQNRALALNRAEGLPVRVIRGAGLDSPFAPEAGYRYDGLYHVESYWHYKGKSGFLVWLFRLTKQTLEQPPTKGPSPPKAPPSKKKVAMLRVERDSAVAKRVKKLHDFTCQVCGTRLSAHSVPYAEGAHIRPLGAGHDGPNTEDNILCLCPNHHVLFDLGAFTIADDLTLIGLPGTLQTVAGHRPNPTHLEYRRNHYGHA